MFKSLYVSTMLLKILDFHEYFFRIEAININANLFLKFNIERLLTFMNYHLCDAILRFKFEGKR